MGSVRSQCSWSVSAVLSVMGRLLRVQLSVVRQSIFRAVLSIPSSLVRSTLQTVCPLLSMFCPVVMPVTTVQSLFYSPLCPCSAVFKYMSVRVMLSLILFSPCSCCPHIISVRKFRSVDFLLKLGTLLHCLCFCSENLSKESKLLIVCFC